MNSKITSNKSLFRDVKSYTPEEILAGGGTTAFGRKRGQNNESLIKALENAPKPEPFSEEEWADLMADIARDK